MVVNLNKFQLFKYTNLVTKLVNNPRFHLEINQIRI